MKETIKKMAHLARLSFPEKDLARYTEKVEAVLKYVKQLEELDIKNIEPTSHAVEVLGKPRDDEMAQCKCSEAIISNAPARDGRFYEVPRVIEES